MPNNTQQKRQIYYQKYEENDLKQTYSGDVDTDFRYFKIKQIEDMINRKHKLT